MARISCLQKQPTQPSAAKPEPMTAETFSQGAEPVPTGVRYCIWAPDRDLAVEVLGKDDVRQRSVPLFRDALGYHHAVDQRGRAGDRYLIRVGTETYPCPASRYQPEDVHGPSLVVSAAEFSWSDAPWQ